ncbi:SEC-C metal-binding domain-containing protein [Cetobacterium sp. ZWU0022]|uniref:SEC-C metal-binding domain-containing protein n=1 Tax=Cetobacterium sp. ZWU0022 TaxID=1340502 RepID=UPI000690CF62|nr:SEC-C metal-binding domain-containing protein [Cetobacterium sp. ZWU0022]
MLVKCTIKCEVCGSTICTKTQVGWLKKHPIRIHCPECNILISGDVIQNQEMRKVEIVFKNAQKISSVEKTKYFIEISGELLTSKIREFQNTDIISFSPYIKSLLSTITEKDEEFGRSIEEFKKNINTFLYFIENEWPLIRRINELWMLKKYKYLSKELGKFLDKECFPVYKENQLEYLRAKHQLFFMFFSPIMSKNFFEETTVTIHNGITELSRKENYKELTKYFVDETLLDIYEQRTFSILSSFVEKFQFFIPALGLENRFYNLEMDGTTVVSFEDIKHFYLDCFEAIGEILPIVIAYNNLLYRNNFKQMKELKGFEGIKEIDDYIGKMKNKGNKVLFCKSDELFDSILDLEEDNGLRNAIGHGSYTYDGVNQIINYYDSERKRGEPKKIYLVEFIQKTLKQFRAIIVLMELIYQTRKSDYVFKGIKSVNPEVFLKKMSKSNISFFKQDLNKYHNDLKEYVENYINENIKNKRKKIGRNDLCFCNSGKKYKKCCGK